MPRTATETSPTPISVYRGQARRGLGEGQGRSGHGEQYLAAEPPLDTDSRTLAMLRPWLSLDASAEDRRKLGDRLCAYSMAPAGDYLLVARLCADGSFFDRPAYFTHGRLFPLASFGAGCDPAVLIGRDDAFEASWRDRDRPRPGPLPSAGQLSAAAIAAVDAEPETAARWLAALLSARMQECPLVVEAPLDAFTADGQPALLAAFALAGLPHRLGRSCRTRIYTRYPRQFLEQLEADFLVLPTAATLELERWPGRLLRIDRQGRALGGTEIEPPCGDFAAEVVRRFRHLPAGLVPFAARVDLLPGVPSPSLVALVYNLAYALANADGDSAFFEKYLLEEAGRHGEEVPWQNLLTSEDWDRFPKPALLRLAGTAEGSLDRGRRHLQAALLLDRGASLLHRALAGHDTMMEVDRRRATDELILADAWLAWRDRAAGEPAAFLRAAALDWLGSSLWRRDRARATREAWSRVVGDLPRIDRSMLEKLIREGRPAWPWISPFELEQLSDLTSRATLPEVTLALTEAAARDGVVAVADRSGRAPAAQNSAMPAPTRELPAFAAAPRPPRRLGRYWISASLMASLLVLAVLAFGWNMRSSPDPTLPTGSSPTRAGRDPQAAAAKNPALEVAFARLFDNLAGKNDLEVTAIYQKHLRALETLEPDEALQRAGFSEGLAELALVGFRRDPSRLRPATLLQILAFLPTFGDKADPVADRARSTRLVLAFVTDGLRAPSETPVRKPR